VRIAGRQYAEAYRQLVNSLRAQFLTLIGKKSALRVAEFALQQAEEALAVGEARLKSKNVAESEINGLHAAVDETRLARDRAQEDLENAMRFFMLSSGETDLGMQAIPDEVPQPIYLPEIIEQLLQRYLQGGSEKTYSILDIHDRIKQADLDYRIAQVRLLPKLGISVSLNQQSQNYVNSGQLTQYVTKSNNYNLVANWSIFDGFATRGAKLSALSRKRSLERSLRTTVDQTMAQVRDEEKQLGFSWRSLEFVQQRFDLATAVLKNVNEIIKLGRASQGDVRSAQGNLNQAELNLIAARGDFLVRWSEFLSNIGIDPMVDCIPQHYLDDGT
jgi:outer membrane protein TolC